MKRRLAPFVWLRDWWYLGDGYIGPLGIPHTWWARRLGQDLSRRLPDVRR